MFFYVFLRLCHYGAKKERQYNCPSKCIIIYFIYFQLPIVIGCLYFNKVFQPLTAPIIIPFTKYFCKNGYIAIIGNMEIIIVAILSEIGVIKLCAVSTSI